MEERNTNFYINDGLIMQGKGQKKYQLLFVMIMADMIMCR